MTLSILALMALGLSIVLVCYPGVDGLHAKGRRLPVWQISMLVSVWLAWLANAMTAPALGAVLLLVILGRWHARQPSVWSACLFGMVALGMATHLWPGFQNLRVLHDVTLSPSAMPLTLYANFDKGLAGLCLLAWAAQPRPGAWRGRRLWQEVGLTSLWVCIGVITVACVSGLVVWAPRWASPPSGGLLGAWGWWDVSWRFLLLNLLFTCVAEEAFFRGLIQMSLVNWCAGKGIAAWPAVVLTAVLFGLAHLGGGWGFAALAALAGLAYGCVCQRTGRVGAAIAVHFALNAVHFMWFSYPRLA